MTSSWHLAATMLLLSAAPSAAQPAGTRPGPEHKKLEVWVGDWTYEMDMKATPLGPASKTAGKVSAKPMLGGLFVEWRGEETGGRWHEVDGYDPVAKRYFWHTYSYDGSVQVVSYVFEGTNVSYSGSVTTGGKLVKIRGTVAFAPDWLSNVEKREVSVDGSTWMPWWESRSVKAKAAPR